MPEGKNFPGANAPGKADGSDACTPDSRRILFGRGPYSFSARAFASAMAFSWAAGGQSS